jgi:glyoxylase-like metal-dependent hydrolase (beta-lactamase superfamily II)
LHYQNSGDFPAVELQKNLQHKPAHLLTQHRNQPSPWYIICATVENKNMNRAIVDRREETATEERSIGSNSWLVAPGVWRLKDIFVNVYIIQDREATGWVLVDTGLKSTASKLRELVGNLFGKGSVPRAIIMTHAHFDHRGSVLELAEEWGVPVYCHHKERPYLTGQAAYPPADPSVGGGLMSLLSFTYPRGPINAVSYLRELPKDGTIEELEDWKWIHTPGHTPGHISLFREKDGVLIAGDAFVTTMQESLLAVATQKKYICGPPKYFTPDWGSAIRSVKTLAALEPSVIATGHGQAMYGEEARKELHKLVREFWKIGLPADGRYVQEAASFDKDGVPVHIPKAKGTMLKKIAIAATLFAIGYLISRQKKNARGFVEKTLVSQLGGTLKGSALGALGATAPSSPAMPAIPLIPAL